MQSTLYLQPVGLVYVGDASEARRIASSLSKIKYAKLQEYPIYEDTGLDHRDANMVFVMENDQTTMYLIHDLCRKTKKQGKTAKTITKKAEYFAHRLNNIIRNANGRYWRTLRQSDQNAEKPSFNQAAVTAYWLDWYFAEYDKELKAPKHEPYTTSVDVSSLCRAADLYGTRPESIPAKCSKIEIHLFTNCCSVCIEWNNCKAGPRLARELERPKYGWQHEPLKRQDLLRIVSGYDAEARLTSTMDTPQNLYGLNNDFYYVRVLWQAEKFTWEKAQGALDKIQEMLLPELGEFKEGCKYEVNVHTYSER
jgi:hypothetical protein